ncbi:hypothetical protein PSYAR_08116 [Pseudomonas syringae pv. aceris str. M302273]|nr:hypothetical protein PSYAR_08116 [Pseudomonas syringae pv. aceris str. M302273]
MAHGSYSVLAPEKHTIEIGVMYGLPVLQTRMLWVVLDSALLKPGNARVVDQYIEAAVRFYDMRCHSLPIFFAAHIKMQITGTISQCSCCLSSEHVVYISDVNKAAFL